MQADKVPVLDAPNGCQFIFKLPKIMWILTVDSLDGNRLRVLQNALVHSTGGTISNNVFVIQILSDPHDILVSMNCHVHVQYDQLRRT